MSPITDELPIEPIHNESDLLRQIAAGDEQAFARLFQHYWDHLYGFALNAAKSAELAEEIVQDSFLIVWEQRATLPGLAKFSDWLFIVTRNKTYNLLRKKVNDPVFVEQLEGYFNLSGDSPERELLLKETRALIGRAATLLPPQQQLIFDLSRQQGQSLDEIAARTGLSKNTVKVHLAKALQTIRNYLRDHASGMVLICCLFELF